MYAEKYAETKYVSINLHNHGGLAMGGCQLFDANVRTILSLLQCPRLFHTYTYDRPEGGKGDNTVGEVCCSLVLTCKLNLSNF